MRFDLGPGGAALGLREAGPLLSLKVLALQEGQFLERAEGRGKGKQKTERFSQGAEGRECVPLTFHFSLEAEKLCQGYVLAPAGWASSSSRDDHRK